LLYTCIHDVPFYIACINITALCNDDYKHFNLKVSRLLLKVRGILPKARKICGRKWIFFFATFEWFLQPTPIYMCIYIYIYICNWHIRFAVEDLRYCYTNNIDPISLFIRYHICDVDVFGTKIFFLNHNYSGSFFVLK
jgi:hypothetical protein